MSWKFWKPRKPSELIRRHLDKTGNGYELDDLVHMGRPDYEDVAEELLAISNRYSTAEFPIGISNPASSEELTALAKRLEAEGR